MEKIIGTFEDDSIKNKLSDLFYHPTNYKIIPFKNKEESEIYINDIKFHYSWEEFKKQQKEQDDLDQNITKLL